LQLKQPKNWVISTYLYLANSTNASIFCYHFMTIFWFLWNHNRFEVQCWGYPLTNFQRFMINGLRNNTLVSFFMKIIYNSAITVCILTKFGTKMCLISLTNLKATWSHFVNFLAVFLQVWEKKKTKKTKKKDWKKWVTFWRLISQEWLAQDTWIYPECWDSHSKFGLVHTRDHGTMNGYKIVFCSSCQYTHIVLTHSVFLGHTTHYCVSCKIINSKAVLW